MRSVEQKKIVLRIYNCLINIHVALRQLALEFLVALTENRPAYGRKLKDFPNNIAQLVLSMMLEMDEYDLAEWNAKVHIHQSY